MKTFFFILDDSFFFQSDPPELSVPILAVNDLKFKYDGTKRWIFKKCNFGLDLNSRVGLVGMNGVGKSSEFVCSLCSLCSLYCLCLVTHSFSMMTCFSNDQTHFCFAM